MKKWAFFTKGTYWVYQDTANPNNIDSTHVTETSYTVSENPKTWINQKIQHLEVRVKSSYNNQGYLYKTTTHGKTFCDNDESSEQDSIPCEHLVKQKINSVGQPSSQAHILLIHPKEGSHQGSALLTDFYETYQLHGQKYHDVVRMKVRDNKVEGTYEVDSLNGPPRGYETVYFYAKHYGVIRKKVKIKQDEDDPGKWRVWDLVRSNIVQ